jgi:DNA-binding response OmpR family regulator
VLVIDDDAAVRQAVARLLGAMGFRMTAADGGEAGLALLDSGETRFDLVVLDWLMPSLSGAEVLRELRRRDPVLPVILMSGYSADSLASSADEHLTRIQKPMTMAQLRAAVRSVSDQLGRGAA